MQDWTSLVGTTGTNVAAPTIPAATTTIDGNIEQAGQPGTTLATTVGGWTIGNNRLFSGIGATTVGLDSSGGHPAFYAGNQTPEDAPFQVSDAGALTASSGLIGGWSLSATAFSVANGGNTVGIDAGGINPAFYAGGSNPATAPFRVMQDGTVVATNLSVTGYLQSGQAAADINTHPTTVSGGKITAGSITANQIAANTITASQIAAGTITATQIQTGTITAASGIVSSLSANVITSGTINANTINVTNLNASNMNNGNLTVGGGGIGNITIQQTNQAGAIYKFTGGSAMWEDSNQNLGLYAVAGGSGTSMFFYVGSSDTNGRLVLNKVGTGQNAMYGGLYIHKTTGSDNGNLNVEGDSQFDGNLNVTGTKHFNVPHPTKPDRRLVYTSAESPEVIVMCRGKAGEEIPQHFLDISEPDTFQTITGVEGNWLVTAVRKGYKDFDPEPLAEAV